MYIDGINVANTSGFVPISNNHDSIRATNQFITDNENSTDATLYFWGDWSNGTH